MTRSVRTILRICALSVIVAAATSVRAADAVSIPELMSPQQQAQWPKYAEQETAMRIEGRFSSFSTVLLRFQSCGLNFYWHDEDRPFPRIPSSQGSRTIEVAGKFGTRGGKPAFFVNQVRELNSDTENVRLRRLALLSGKPTDWYALGDWAKARAEFYHDSDLSRSAQEIYLEGFKREVAGLGENDLDAKLELSKKYAQFGIADEERAAYVYGAFADRWKTLKTAPPAELRAMLDKLRSHLPGSDKPLDAEDDLLAKYRRDPKGAYESAGADRQKLHRALAAEIELALIRAEARAKKTEPLELADLIDRQVPESHALADELRVAELDRRLQNVTALSREDALALAELFTKRGDAAKALLAKRKWVEARELVLVKDGRANDYLQAAREYESMLGDEAAAARLLMQAHRLAPENKEPSDQLKRLGYRLENGEWLTPEQRKNSPIQSLPNAASSNLLGMNRANVRKSSGAPDSVTRVYSAGQVNEVWLYLQDGRPSLTIHFLGTGKGDDLKVVKLVQ